MTDYRVAIFGGCTTVVVYEGNNPDEYQKAIDDLKDVFSNVDYFRSVDAFKDKNDEFTSMNNTFFVD